MVEHCRERGGAGGFAESEAAGGAGEADAEAAAAGAPSDAERGLLVELDEQQRRYTSSFARLRELKGEIEYTRKLLEAAAVRLQADFEGWYAKALLERRTAPEAGARGGGARPAGGGGAESDDVKRFYAAKDQLMRLAGNR